MKKAGVSISAGAFLLFSALYFFDDALFLPALLPAVAVHEAGHALALGLGGARIRGLRLDLRGLNMDYSGGIPIGAEFAAALAGPVLGILYAVLASRAGEALESEFLLFSGGLSLVLSLFNLLPARPLDGGRALALFFGEGPVASAAGLITALAVMAGGLWLFLEGRGAALCFAGAWLLLAWAESPCKTRKNGIK